MKVLKGGIFANDGIHIVCDCGCEYVIQTKKDLNFDIMLDDTIVYNSRCPECHQNKYLGHVDKPINGKRQFISSMNLQQRNDWQHRFHINTIEEAKKFEHHDYIEDLEKGLLV